MKTISVIAAVTLMIILACTPKPSSTTPPMPAPTTAATPSSDRVNAPAPTAEESNWAKVVAEAKKEGKATLYTFNFAGDVAGVVAKAFDEKYGIKLEFVTGIGAVLLERMKAEKAARRFIADIYTTAPSWVATAKNEGVTQSIGDLPVFKEKDVWAMAPRLDPEGHILAFGVSRSPPYVNTNLVKPGDEPRSYRDFLDPKWKGKIILSDPATDPLPIALYLLGKRHGFMDDDYARRLGQQELKMAPSIRDADNMLLRGEAPLRWLGTVTTLNVFIKEGAPIKPVDMAEGTRQAASPALGIAAEAPHPNAARLFINWLLSAEGQTIFHRFLGSDPVRSDVGDFGPPAGRIMAKKYLVVDLALELETVKTQRERLFQKALGLDK